ncbi:hypothetical protein [Bergeyella zoohelcum]|uniref:Uncharacterized protein n=1 Tax=Bergeyella zoohelcum TaxID=1015 RepID=A0A380ZWN9_9FLAO|nr:hypothetical protein [Bergeyella zoohelcum]EKB58390.1 hypothetical protein HMPREF9700_01842 [Bergeyella zoohelcum CCUG 30536]SUV53149.1 Uncharacterised protein [Bergeyella zoohelcum]
MNKTKFKIKKELLLIINNALQSPLILQEMGSKNILTTKLPISVFYEVIDILGKKFLTVSKTANFELYKHSADAFYLMLNVVLELGNLSVYERNQIDQLKNEIHQKKIVL